MERSRELEEYIKEYREERVKVKREYLEENLTKLENVFRDKLGSLISWQIEKQKEDNSDKIKYLYLCRLMSSGYTESYESILGMSSVMLYLDEIKSQVYWYPDLVYKDIDQDMKTVEKILGKKFIRLEDSELFRLKQKLLCDDWDLLCKCFVKLLKSSFSLITDSPLKLEDELKILTGVYMDNLQIVWIETGKGRKNNE